MKPLSALAAAFLLLGACATVDDTATYDPASPPNPEYADGISREYLVVRDSVLYAAPRPDAPHLGRIYKGETITAAYSRATPQWMIADLQDGRRAYLFGNPIFPQE